MQHDWHTHHRSRNLLPLHGFLLSICESALIKAARAHLKNSKGDCRHPDTMEESSKSSVQTTKESASGKLRVLADTLNWKRSQAQCDAFQAPTASCDGYSGCRIDGLASPCHRPLTHSTDVLSPQGPFLDFHSLEALLGRYYVPVPQECRMQAGTSRHF